MEKKVTIQKTRHGLIADLKNGKNHIGFSCWKKQPTFLTKNATHFGFVYKGIATLSVKNQKYKLNAGMYFSCTGSGKIDGTRSEGIIISQVGFHGFFQIGGPIEKTGRLKYINGCTDSLIIPPTIKGDACLNLLAFPKKTVQTEHTHPSFRIGIIAQGNGFCVTPEGSTKLNSGDIFIIPKNSSHNFITTNKPMLIIAYHPDSDFGPTHKDHPMINRTIIS